MCCPGGSAFAGIMARKPLGCAAGARRYTGDIGEIEAERRGERRAVDGRLHVGAWRSLSGVTAHPATSTSPRYTAISVGAVVSGDLTCPMRSTTTVGAPPHAVCVWVTGMSATNSETCCPATLLQGPRDAADIDRHVQAVVEKRPGARHRLQPGQRQIGAILVPEAISPIRPKRAPAASAARSAGWS